MLNCIGILSEQGEATTASNLSEYTIGLSLLIWHLLQKSKAKSKWKNVSNRQSLNICHIKAKISYRNYN